MSKKKKKRRGGPDATYLSRTEVRPLRHGGRAGSASQPMRVMCIKCAQGRGSNNEGMYVP